VVHGSRDVGEQSAAVKVAAIALWPEESTARRRPIAVRDVSGQAVEPLVAAPVGVLVPELDIAKEPSKTLRRGGGHVLDRQDATLAGQSCSRST
jgi:hypothetical protein